MADIPASNWSETDASNSSASPDGMPEGMAPSGVNNTGRAIMGALKRFWNKTNAVKTTAGTTSAYTLTYDVAPGAYYDGEIISFVVNATNAAAATIDVNALGAKALRLFGGNLLAGALITGQIVQARYGSAAGAFDIIPQNGWVVLGTATPSAAANADFPGIPAAVNNLMLMLEIAPGTDGVNIGLQTYGADGVLDTGASDYSSNQFRFTSTGTDSANQLTSTFMILNYSGNAVDNGTFGFGGQITASNIQSSTFTKFSGQFHYLDSAGVGSVGVSIAGGRQEADRITGVRLITSSGTITGRVTLYGSV